LTNTEFFCAFSIATRSSRGMKTSLERVITTCSCDSRNLRETRLATSSVAIFSAPPNLRYAPLSFPPWPASTTTVLNDLLVFLVPTSSGPGPVAQAARKTAEMNSEARQTDRVMGIVLTSKPLRPPKVSRRADKNRLFFGRPDLKALPPIMRIRFLSIPVLLLVANFLFAAKPTPAPKAAATPAPTISKPVVDQTAQTIIYCYHRLVDKVRYPGTEITPAVFEQQMKMLKDRGITVIGLQDLLAWKRGEKNIPPRCAVITFDD